MEYYKYLRQYVGHQPIILPGAVVIILNDQNEVLLQKRRDGGYGLPGGLMELGESLEETAQREVLEETGLTISELHLLGIFSGSEYYLKMANKDELYSVTAVYYTREQLGNIEVDLSESESMEYFPLTELPTNLIESYKNYIEPYLPLLLEGNKSSKKDKIIGSSRY